MAISTPNGLFANADSDCLFEALTPHSDVLRQRLHVSFARLESFFFFLSMLHLQQRHRASGKSLLSATDALLAA